MAKDSRNKKDTARSERDLDLEISFLEGIVRRDPDYVEALRVLGDDYTRRGRSGDGLKVDLHLARLCPDDAMVHYNLACSYSLTEQIELAVASLDRAIHLGYRDFKWMAKDPDLKNLRANPAYKPIQAKLRLLQKAQSENE